MVEYGEDYKVKFVDFGENLKIKYVEYGEDSIGNWKMVEYGEKYPQWGFERHMGYPTRQHREAIAEHGLSPIHRRSFRLKPVQTSLL